MSDENRERDHYFATAPSAVSAPTTFDVVVPGASLAITTDHGVFSHGRLDAGTAVLLQADLPLPALGNVIDLGCGAGPIALTMATRSPQATVWAVDVNERARTLCARNAAANRVGNVNVVAPDEVPADLRFDAIWSNPPIRIGKRLLHEVLRSWLGRLTADGEAVLVVHKHLGADSLQRWLIEQGYPTTRVVSRGGYRVLRIRS